MTQLKSSSFEFKSAIDGLNLYAQKKVPNDPKKIVIVQHGIGDHGGRYQYLVDALADGETGFVAIDGRGHGLADGKRGHAESLHEFAIDLFQLVELTGEEYPDAKIYLLGHSMGGAIALDFCLVEQYHSSLEGLILSAPALRLVMSPVDRIKEQLAKRLARILPGVCVDLGLDGSKISTDKAEAKKFEEDRLTHGFMSFGLGNSLLDTISKIQANWKKIKVPVLIYHGTGDRIVDVKGSEELYEHIGSQDKEIQIYSDYAHESHNEGPKKREILFTDIKKWLQSH